MSKVYLRLILEFVRRRRKLARISYDEMIELASIGAKVLEIRSVEFAKKFLRAGARALDVFTTPRELGWSTRRRA